MSVGSSLPYIVLHCVLFVHRMFQTALNHTSLDPSTSHVSKTSGAHTLYKHGKTITLPCENLWKVYNQVLFSLCLQLSFCTYPFLGFSSPGEIRFSLQRRIINILANLLALQLSQPGNSDVRYHHSARVGCKMHFKPFYF